MFNVCFQDDPLGGECNTFELESTIQTCWDRKGVSLKNPDITKTGTVCEVQQIGDNFTIFVVCTTRGWSWTENEGYCVALQFFVSI